MRYDNFDDFQRDLDSDRLSDDPFGVEAEIGSLDDEDLEHLVVHHAAQPPKPKAPAPRRKPAAAKPHPTAKPKKPKKAAA